MVSACALSAPVSSYAADDGVRNENSRFLPSTPQQTKVSFVRKDDLAPGQFALRVAFPVATSGCAKFTHPYHKTTTKPPLMTVTIRTPTLVNDRTARHSHYECDTGMKVPSSDIYFSKEQILSGGITTIALQDDKYNIRKDFRLNMNNSFVELVPSSDHDYRLGAFQAQDLRHNTNALKYWFYPDNTVLLYVPMAEHGTDLEEEIKRFAADNNLIPLKDRLPGFKKPITKPHHFYFVAAKDMDIPDNGHKLGTITATKTEYGLIEDETVETQLDVFAKKPDLYE